MSCESKIVDEYKCFVTDYVAMEVPIKKSEKDFE